MCELLTMVAKGKGDSFNVKCTVLSTCDIRFTDCNVRIYNRGLRITTLRDWKRLRELTLETIPGRIEFAWHVNWCMWIDDHKKNSFFSFCSVHPITFPDHYSSKHLIINKRSLNEFLFPSNSHKRMNMNSNISKLIWLIQLKHYAMLLILCLPLFCMCFFCLIDRYLMTNRRNSYARSNIFGQECH